MTIIIPARNEESSLPAALASVLDQTFPLESTEVVVVDGDSTDATATVARSALEGTALCRWAVLHNPDGSTPSNLNVGLAWAEGEIIVRVDARSKIPPEYVERTVDALEDARMAVVGGRQVARSADDRLISRSIARALNNPFANGGARYRDHRVTSGPCETAYLGVFRTGQLRSVDGWNLDFASNQDFELCQRMARFGIVWYDARLAVEYQPRRSLRALFRQYRRFGRWKVTYWSSTGDRPQRRQSVLLAAPALALTAGAVALALTPAIAVRLGLVGASGLLAIDAIGQDRPARITERMGSSLAMAVIGAGWWSGAVQQGLESLRVRPELGGLRAERSASTVRPGVGPATAAERRDRTPLG